MVIGIIGTSIAGLIAGKRLAQAGHDVTVIERSHAPGGKFATRKLDGLYLDYGISHVSARTKTFRAFIDEMKGKGILKKWSNNFRYFDENGLHEENPHSREQEHYAGNKGLNAIAGNLIRWVDVIGDVKAGGITYIGPDRTRKRSWIINLTDISVFECDAVIIAAPAVPAYGILQTAQDETPVRRLNTVIDEITYNGCFSLAAIFDKPVPEWKGIECSDASISWIGNESSKQEGAAKTGLVIRSTNDFYRKHLQKDDGEAERILLEKASDILGSWMLQPKASYLHRWKYFEVKNPVNEYFMELEMEDGPLALIGDYFGGKSPENAFLSGYNLAEYWINKYSEVAVK